VRSSRARSGVVVAAWAAAIVISGLVAVGGLPGLPQGPHSAIIIRTSFAVSIPLLPGVRRACEHRNTDSAGDPDPGGAPTTSGTSSPASTRSEPFADGDDLLRATAIIDVIRAALGDRAGLASTNVVDGVFDLPIVGMTQDDVDLVREMSLASPIPIRAAPGNVSLYELETVTSRIVDEVPGVAPDLTWSVGIDLRTSRVQVGIRPACTRGDQDAIQQLKDLANSIAAEVLGERNSASGGDGPPDIVGFFTISEPLPIP